MNNNQKQVEEFMAKAGQDLPRQPTVATREVRIARAKMILEEALEYVSAAGLQIYTIEGSHILSSTKKLGFRSVAAPNLTEMVDAVADISYINNGTALAHGVDMEPIDEIVHESNMGRFGEGSYLNDDGKWIKPKDWVAPTALIETEILRQQGMEPVEPVEPVKEADALKEADAGDTVGLTNALSENDFSVTGELANESIQVDEEGKSVETGSIDESVLSETKTETKKSRKKSSKSDSETSE